MSQMSKVSCTYGAPMGRGESYDQPVDKCRCYRVRIDSGGYDDGGAYWGVGEPLYCCTDDEDFQMFTRAGDRAEAQELFKARCPAIEWRRSQVALVRALLGMPADK